ncbi:MAG TPA: HypC/HybG/HupF family hydrogenase formation chaperone [Candidatus Nanoarchaeia archaeon]
MCLATPVKVTKLNKNKAVVDALGKKSRVDTSLLQNVKMGDYLYASRGLAIKKVSRSEAEKVLELVKKWGK